MVLLCVAAAAGCASAADEADETRRGRASGEQRGAATEAPRPARYALVNEIYSQEESTTYVHVLTSLDEGTPDPARALEYPGGRATIGSVGGWLFVGSPQEPLVTRFTVADDGTLTRDREISFANFGLSSAEIDDWGNTFVSAEKAYLFAAESGSVIVWNPTTLEIIGEVELRDEFSLVRDGFALNASPAVVRGNRVLRAVSWVNWDSYEFSEEQYLLVIDSDEDRPLALVEERRCPALTNRVERDSAGDLYFSNWIWNVGATLSAGAHKSCALRVRRDSEAFDPDWTLPYADLTAGREAAMLALTGPDQGLLSVFHDDRVPERAGLDPSELVSTANWRLWRVDLDARSASPLEGIEWNAGAVSTYHIGGRSFVFVPGEGWESTRVHELSDDGATLHWDLPGWSYQFLELR